MKNEDDFDLILRKCLYQEVEDEGFSIQIMNNIPNESFPMDYRLVIGWIGICIMSVFLYMGVGVNEFIIDLMKSYVGIIFSIISILYLYFNIFDLEL